jgi:nitroreductase
VTTTTRALTVTEAASRRRSIWAYAPDLVPRADIEAILAVTALAPSAFNLQPWRFVIVQDARLKQALAEAAHGQRQILGAPAVIVLYTDMRDALANADAIVHPSLPEDRRAGALRSIERFFAGKGDDEREDWGAQQGYIALGYLLLAAAEHGYQTSPMLGFDADRVKAALDLPSHVPVAALVSIGRGVEDGRPHHRLPLERLARFV